MRIKKISYQDLSADFGMEGIEFLEEKELLVGKSGAGKTQILSAIHMAAQLALGRLYEVVNAFELTMEFSILDDGNREVHYVWNVNADFVPPFSEKTKDSNVMIKKESLCSDYETLFIKNEMMFQILDYKSAPMPKDNESLISQYRKERQIRDIFLEFATICLRDIESDMRKTRTEEQYSDICRNCSQEPNLLEYMGELLSPFEQYGILQRMDGSDYAAFSEDILECCQEIFPEIEEISYRKDSFQKYGIAIRTGGRWITQQSISSGMLKAIWIVIRLKLLPKNSIFLLDELENGLGINCIENVCDLILNEREDVQVIATSHHPYIINNIPMENWMIVRRDDGRITSHRATEFSLGRSRHDAYLQLVNKLQSM